MKIDKTNTEEELKKRIKITEIHLLTARNCDWKGEIIHLEQMLDFYEEQLSPMIIVFLSKVEGTH